MCSSDLETGSRKQKNRKEKKEKSQAVELVGGEHTEHAQLKARLKNTLSMPSRRLKNTLSMPSSY